MTRCSPASRSSPGGGRCTWWRRGRCWSTRPRPGTLLGDAAPGAVRRRGRRRWPIPAAGASSWSWPGATGPASRRGTTSARAVGSRRHRRRVVHHAPEPADGHDTGAGHGAGADPDRDPPDRAHPREPSTTAGWTARGRYDLRERFDTRDEAWLGSLRSGCRWAGAGAVARAAADRGRLRAARPARRPAGQPRGRVAGPARRAAAADRDQRRAGLLRHRPHVGVDARPGGARRSSTGPTCSSAGPTGPGCSATTPPTWSATATAGWWPPAPGRTSTAGATRSSG